MPMHESSHAGITVRAAHSLPPWAPGLAVAVLGAFGGAAGEHAFADLVTLDKLFPADWSKSQRRDRLSRLLETPIELGGRWLMTAESRPATKRYEKTRRVIVRAGALSSAPVLAAAPPSPPAVAPPLVVATQYAAPALPSGPLEQLLAGMTDILARLQRLEGGAPPSTPAGPTTPRPEPEPAAPPDAEKRPFDANDTGTWYDAENHLWFEPLKGVPPPGVAPEPWMVKQDTNRIHQILNYPPAEKADAILELVGPAPDDFGRDRNVIEEADAVLPVLEADWARLHAETGDAPNPMLICVDDPASFGSYRRRTRILYFNTRQLLEHLGVAVDKRTRRMPQGLCEFDTWRQVTVYLAWVRTELDLCEAQLMLRDIELVEPTED